MLKKITMVLLFVALVLGVSVFGAFAAPPDNYTGKMVMMGTGISIKDNSSPNAFITKLQLSSGTSDFDLASAAITKIYNEYPTYFGTKDWGVTSGTYAGSTYYFQCYLTGTAILAWIDGYMYWTEGKNWYPADDGVVWKASSDYTAASAAITMIYNKYPTYFGTKSGRVILGISGGTYYTQCYTTGTAILAWTDGYMYWTEGKNWYPAGGVAWKTSSDYYTAASTAITQIYNENPKSFGTKSGSVTSGTSRGGTYYVQYFTNGGFLIAWSDGYVYSGYYYYSGNGGGWTSTGVKWK
ncbi:MAG: hypothetical protein HQK96_08775 [Nitrospirae bacterium]|nr:hypothetical protein [Nitrospirota bacterium]